MILNELMQPKSEVYTLTKSGRISAAANMMRVHGVGSIVIVDDLNHVIGMVTDRDIAMVLALGAATPDSFLGEIMSKNVALIYDSMTLFDATQVFRNANVKRLPVIDNYKQLVGIVSLDDVMALLAREMYDTCRGLEPKLGHVV